jgi:hypothetical protein
MTHAEKLQQLFEAALKDSSDLHKAPTRAFPTPLGVPQVPAIQAASAPEPAPAPVVEISALPVANAGLSDAVSAEPATLPDRQTPQETGSGRCRAMIALGVFLALAGGGFCWFVQSPQRVLAWQEAFREVRSVGDATSIVSKYQAAMDKAKTENSSR